jgi:hypothetical protein
MSGRREFLQQTSAALAGGLLAGPLSAAEARGAAADKKARLAQLASNT